MYQGTCTLIYDELKIESIKIYRDYCCRLFTVVCGVDKNGKTEILIYMSVYRTVSEISSVKNGVHNRT